MKTPQQIREELDTLEAQMTSLDVEERTIKGEHEKSLMRLNELDFKRAEIYQKQTTLYKELKEAQYRTLEHENQKSQN